MIFLSYFLFKCIVSLLTWYFYCHAFYTWASGSDDRDNPIPRIDVNKLIDWLIWFWNDIFRIYIIDLTQMLGAVGN